MTDISCEEGNKPKDIHQLLYNCQLKDFSPGSIEMTFFL